MQSALPPSASAVPGVLDRDLPTLARSPALAGLSEADLRAFAGYLARVDLPGGTTVVREGDAGGSMYILLEGEARIHRNQLELRPLRPGDHFGELGLIGVRPRATSVQADGPVRLARLGRDRYLAMSEERPPLALRVLQALVASLGDALVSMTDSVGLLLRQRSLPRVTEVEAQASGVARRVRMGTPLRDLLPAEQDGSPVVAGLVDQKPAALDAPLVSDATVEPLTMASWEGRRVFRRSAGLLLLEAAHEAAPSVVVRLGPSIGPAQIVEFEGVDDGDRGDLAASLNAEMGRLVAADVPFRDELWTVEEARSHFVAQGWDDAASLLRAWRDPTVPLVSCGNVHALGNGPTVPSAGVLRGARVVPHPGGLLLDFGDLLRRHAETPGRPAPDPVELEKRAPRYGGEMTREKKRWLAALGITCAGAFNDVCVSGQVAQLIRVAEGFHEKRIGALADAIAARRGRVRVICVAGPSSSGKTTFIKRLTVQLEIDGIRTAGISLDDYYVDRARTPRDDKGEYDFEALEALDVAHFQAQIAALLRGERVRTPRYDFLAGKSLRDGGRDVELGADDVVLVEGIHGLNPALLGGAADAAQVFRIFIHPATTLPFDRLQRVAPADVRLLRRIVRDRHHRGYKAADNILRWPSVRRGEAVHIYPFLPGADSVFDTSLVYEISVLKVFADRYLLEVPEGHAAFPTAWRLRHLIDRFVTIYPDHVPPTSILREFIGGSGFEY